MSEVAFDELTRSFGIESDGPPSIDGPADRRVFQRHLGKATTTVFRDRDLMRSGLSVALETVSITGVGFVSPGPFENGEQIKLQLHNEIQRFTANLRGIVRWQLAQPDGRFRVGVELQSRLSAIDLLMLKRAGADDRLTDAKTWF